MSPRGLDDAQIMLRIIAERETEITELRQKLEQQEKEKPKLSDEEQRLHAELERMTRNRTKCCDFFNIWRAYVYRQNEHGGWTSKKCLKKYEEVHPLPPI